MKIQTIAPDTSVYFGRGLDTMTRAEAAALVERLGGKVAATPNEAQVFILGRSYPKKVPKGELLSERQFLELVRLTEDSRIGALQLAYQNAEAAALRASGCYERALIAGASKEERDRALEISDRAIAELRVASRRVAEAAAFRWT